MSTRQSRYETVGDGSDEGNSSYWIVLFCQRYWLAGVGGRGSGRRAFGGQDSPTWIERSIVFVTIIFEHIELPAKLLDYFLRSNKSNINQCYMCWCTLFLTIFFGIEMVLCDLYLKRFDLTKGLLFKTFVITVWYKLCRCDHSVLQFKSFSLLMNWYTE